MDYNGSALTLHSVCSAHKDPLLALDCVRTSAVSSLFLFEYVTHFNGECLTGARFRPFLLYERFGNKGTQTIERYCLNCVV